MRWIAVLAVGACACTSRERVTIPPPPFEATLEVLGVQKKGELVVVAHDLDTGALALPLDFEGDDIVQLEAALYAGRFEQLPRGVIPPAMSDDPLGVPIPHADAVYSVVVTADGATEWQPSTPSLLAPFRYRSFFVGAEQCIRADGCFEPDDAKCNVPCNVSITPDPPMPPMPPAGPTPPELPELTPCPTGWTERAIDEVTTCEPWEHGARTSCPEGQARFPGDVACAALGASCPSGEWPSDLPARGKIYVRAGGAPGGDGSETAPFGDLSAATMAAGPDDVIVLGTGVHTLTEQLIVNRALTFIGACAEGTRVEAVMPFAVPLFVITAPGVVLKDLSIRDVVECDAGGVELESVSTHGLTLQREARASIRSGSVNGSLVVLHSTVTATRAFISGGDVLANGPESALELTSAAIVDANGVQAYAGAKVVIEQSVLEDLALGGVLATQVGTSVTLRESIVRDIVASSEGEGGEGLFATSGAALRLDRAIIERTRNLAIHVRGNEGVLDARDVVVEDVDVDLEQGSGGIGVACIDARVIGERIWIRGAHDRGISLSRGCDLDATDVTIIDQPVGLSGVSMEPTSSARIARTRVERTGEFGFEVAIAGLRLDDVLIRDLRGPAISGVGPPEVIVSGARIEQVAHRAFDFYSATGGPTPHIVLSDVEISTVMEEGATAGIGLFGMIDAPRIDAELERVEIDAAGAGLSVTRSDVRVMDLRVTGGSRPGIEAQHDVVIEGERIVVARNSCMGVLVGGTPQTRVTLRELVASDTRGEASSCGAAITAAGVHVRDDAVLDLSRFVLEHNLTEGVVLDAGELDLREGEIRGHAVGARMRAPIDLLRIGTRVRYSDNQANLDVQ